MCRRKTCVVQAYRRSSAGSSDDRVRESSGVLGAGEAELVRTLPGLFGGDASKRFRRFAVVYTMLSSQLEAMVCTEDSLNISWKT